MRDPDFKGMASVWRVKRTPAVADAHVEDWGYADGGIATYLINGPFHPFWSWWYLACIHLRPIPGAPPPNLQYPEAEYEIMCVSLNPTPEPPRGHPDIDKIEAGDITGGMPGFLDPPDWVVQFHGVTDEQAAQVAEHAARAIASGVSCDSDLRSWWKTAIPNTVKHILGE